jgi:gamma-glutamylputrescine oxidase
MSVEALQLVQQRIGAHGIDCEYVPGHLSLAESRRKSRALDAWVEHLARDYDYPLQKIAPAELPEWVASRKFHAAAFDPIGAFASPEVLPWACRRSTRGR